MDSGPERSHHLWTEQNTRAAAHNRLAGAVHVVRKAKAGAEVHSVAVIGVVSGTDRTDRHIGDIETVRIDENAAGLVLRRCDHVPEVVVAKSRIQGESG